MSDSDSSAVEKMLNTMMTQDADSAIPVLTHMLGIALAHAEEGFHSRVARLQGITDTIASIAEEVAPVGGEVLGFVDGEASENDKCAECSMRDDFDQDQEPPGEYVSLIEGGLVTTDVDKITEAIFDFMDSHQIIAEQRLAVMAVGLAKILASSPETVDLDELLVSVSQVTIDALEQVIDNANQGLGLMYRPESMNDTTTSEPSYIFTAPKSKQ